MSRVLQNPVVFEIILGSPRNGNRGKRYEIGHVFEGERRK